MKRIFYISDLELFRESVIQSEQRPFKNSKEMYLEIRKNWMQKVKPNEKVYILGDVGMYHQEELAKILHELPGRKYLVIGNHDVYNIKNRNFRREFEEISPYMEINDQGRKVVLSHYPFEEWNGYHEGYYHLHGHVRNSKTLLKKERRYCVSCNETNFGPVTLDELIEGEKSSKLDNMFTCRVNEKTNV